MHKLKVTAKEWGPKKLEKRQEPVAVGSWDLGRSFEMDKIIGDKLGEEPGRSLRRPLASSVMDSVGPTSKFQQNTLIEKLKHKLKEEK